VRWGFAALILAACHGSGWREERALGPFLPALDRDGDGAVAAAEWGALAWAAPDFTDVDLDGDGRLSTSELAAQLRLQDPMTFDAAEIRGIPPRKAPRGPKRDRSMTQPCRHLLDLFGFLADEARAAGFSGALPDEGSARAAARTEDLADPAVQALLGRYAAAWAEVGLAFPAGLLRPAAPSPAAPMP
jgi:hypothetical protein